MSESDGNLVSLRDHLERLIEAREKAVEIAAKELERRLDVLNHAHAQSLADRTQFVTKESNDAKWDAFDGRVKTIELASANTAGRMWALGIAAAFIGGIVGSVAAAVIMGVMT